MRTEPSAAGTCGQYMKSWPGRSHTGNHPRFLVASLSVTERLEVDKLNHLVGSYFSSIHPTSGKTYFPQSKDLSWDHLIGWLAKLGSSVNPTYEELACDALRKVKEHGLLTNHES